MKKMLSVALMLFLATATSYAQKIVYYSTVISNPDKTIDFDFGFYPKTMQYVEPAGQKGYTVVRCAVINQKTAKAFDWKDDKVHIYLKSGKLIRNYTTKAETGDYAVRYSVQPGETHYQEYCFSHKFTLEDIEKIWIVMGDNEIFELFRGEVEPKPKTN
ncbi:hypothetical protein [Pedobacter sp.]